MSEKSISAHIKSTYSLEHNNREIVCANVDATRSCNNYYLVKSNHHNINGHRFATIDEIYDKVFEPSWREFQEKQRPCRRYNGTYLEWIREKKFNARTKTTDSRYKDKAINEAYEIVFQIGNMDDTGYIKSPDDAKKSEVVMKQVADYIYSLPYMCVITDKELNDENWKPPNSACLIILNQCLHMDEQCCGMHLTVIPVCNSQRGSKKQALFKRCFEQLGYPTTFVDVTNENGQRVPKVDKDNKIRKDPQGNIIYKKQVKDKGVLDWLDELKEWCADRMKEEFNWDRKETVGDGRRHLEIEDYKVYRAKERQKELEAKMQITEKEASESALKSAIKIFNEAEECNNIETIDTTELWKEYNDISNEFWIWYHKESDNIKEALLTAKNELDYYQRKQQYLDELANRTGWLIGIIIKLISKAIFKHRRDMYIIKTNELIVLRNKLKIDSKQMSSKSAMVRKMIREKDCEKDLIIHLSNMKKMIHQNFEQYKQQEI